MGWLDGNRGGGGVEQGSNGWVESRRPAQRSGVERRVEAFRARILEIGASPMTVSMESGYEVYGWTRVRAVGVGGDDGGRCDVLGAVESQREGGQPHHRRVDPAPRPLSSNAMLFQDGANQRRCDGDQGWV